MTLRHAGRHELPKPQPAKERWYRAKWLGLPVLVWMALVALATTAIAVVAWLGTLNFSGTAETDESADVQISNVLTEAVRVNGTDVEADVLALTDGDRSITFQWPEAPNGEYLRQPYSLSGHHVRAVMVFTNYGGIPADLGPLTVEAADAYIGAWSSAGSTSPPNAAAFAAAEADGKPVILETRYRGDPMPPEDGNSACVGGTATRTTATLQPGESICVDLKIAFTDLALPGQVYDLGTGNWDY